MSGIYIFLVGLFFAISIMLTLIAGILDYTNRESIGKISKQHLWNDGIYMMLLAIFFLHFSS